MDLVGRNISKIQVEQRRIRKENAKTYEPIQSGKLKRCLAWEKVLKMVKSWCRPIVFKGQNFTMRGNEVQTEISIETNGETHAAEPVHLSGLRTIA